MVPVGHYKRAGGVNGILRQIADMGGHPERLFGEFGFSVEDFENHDTYLHYPSLVALLDACAEKLCAPFFGFELGKRQSADALGPLAALMLAAPRIGEALRLLNRYMHVHAPGASYRYEADEGSPRVEYRVLDPGSTNSRQINELSMTTAFNIIRAVVGKSFSPVEVHIASDRPTCRSEELESYLSAPVIYRCSVSAIIFTREFVDQRIDTSNPTLLRLAQEHLERFAPLDQQDIRTRIEEAIRHLLPTGGCTLSVVAAQLGLHPRSLQNRLLESGLEFREIVRQERVRQASAYLQKTRTPLSEIAILLGYSDQSAFTRAFTSWTGVSPMKHRKNDGGAGRAAVPEQLHLQAGQG